MTHPRILVLLAAFNGGKWVAEQINSVLRQEGVDVDLIASDDGSTDDTLTGLAAFAEESRVHLIAPPEPTGSAAQHFLWVIRNTPRTHHGFVAFCDQDDIWNAEKLARACAALQQSGAAGYSCAVTAFWEDGREAVLSQSARLTKADFMFEGAGQGCTFVLNGEFYDRVRAFLLEQSATTRDVHYHDWTVYALSRAWKLAWTFDQDPLVRYRQHGGNDTGARASLRGIRKRMRLIKSGWYGRQLRIIADICFSAAPADPTISQWRRLLREPRAPMRRLRIAGACIRGGRRRLRDNAVLILAALMGWI